jgi:hypothetical protein
MVCGRRSPGRLFTFFIEENSKRLRDRSRGIGYVLFRFGEGSLGFGVPDGTGGGPSSTSGLSFPVGGETVGAKGEEEKRRRCRSHFLSSGP